ncbi:uncharacterized protein LOC135396970 [Ornithodoros turicata]|uniref:uncharacterized protein LOC135396970 n=1 Tax=Ornithodoros turicata TaxID=34597 RepID=UPI0031397E63
MSENAQRRRGQRKSSKVERKKHGKRQSPFKSEKSDELMVSSPVRDVPSDHEIPEQNAPLQASNYISFDPSQAQQYEPSATVSDTQEHTFGSRKRRSKKSKRSKRKKRGREPTATVYTPEPVDENEKFYMTVGEELADCGQILEDHQTALVDAASTVFASIPLYYHPRRFGNVLDFTAKCSGRCCDHPVPGPLIYRPEATTTEVGTEVVVDDLNAETATESASANAAPPGGPSEAASEIVSPGADASLPLKIAEAAREAKKAIKAAKSFRQASKTMTMIQGEGETDAETRKQYSADLMHRAANLAKKAREALERYRSLKAMAASVDVKAEVSKKETAPEEGAQPTEAPRARRSSHAELKQGQVQAAALSEMHLPPGPSWYVPPGYWSWMPSPYPQGGASVPPQSRAQLEPSDQRPPLQRAPMYDGMFYTDPYLSSYSGNSPRFPPHARDFPRKWTSVPDAANEVLKWKERPLAIAATAGVIKKAGMALSQARQVEDEASKLHKISLSTLSEVRKAEAGQKAYERSRYSPPDEEYGSPGSLRADDDDTMDLRYRKRRLEYRATGATDTSSMEDVGYHDKGNERVGSRRRTRTTPDRPQRDARYDSGLMQKPSPFRDRSPELEGHLTVERREPSRRRTSQRTTRDDFFERPGSTLQSGRGHSTKQPWEAFDRYRDGRTARGLRDSSQMRYSERPRVAPSLDDYEDDRSTEMETPPDGMRQHYERMSPSVSTRTHRSKKELEYSKLSDEPFTDHEADRSKLPQVSRSSTDVRHLSRLASGMALGRVHGEVPDDDTMTFKERAARRASLFPRRDKHGETSDFKRAAARRASLSGARQLQLDKKATQENISASRATAGRRVSISSLRPLQFDRTQDDDMTEFKTMAKRRASVSASRQLQLDRVQEGDKAAFKAAAQRRASVSGARQLELDRMQEGDKSAFKAAAHRRASVSGARGVQEGDKAAFKAAAQRRASVSAARQLQLDSIQEGDKSAFKAAAHRRASVSGARQLQLDDAQEDERSPFKMMAQRRASVSGARQLQLDHAQEDDRSAFRAMAQRRASATGARQLLLDRIQEDDKSAFRAAAQRRASVSRARQLQLDHAQEGDRSPLKSVAERRETTSPSLQAFRTMAQRKASVSAASRQQQLDRAQEDERSAFKEMAQRRKSVSGAPELQLDHTQRDDSSSFNATAQSGATLSASRQSFKGRAQRRASVSSSRQPQPDHTYEVDRSTLKSMSPSKASALGPRQLKLEQRLPLDTDAFRAKAVKGSSASSGLDSAGGVRTLNTDRTNGISALRAADARRASVAAGRRKSLAVEKSNLVGSTGLHPGELRQPLKVTGAESSHPQQETREQDSQLHAGDKSPEGGSYILLPGVTVTREQMAKNIEELNKKAPKDEELPAEPVKDNLYEKMQAAKETSEPLSVIHPSERMQSPMHAMSPGSHQTELTHPQTGAPQRTAPSDAQPTKVLQETPQRTEPRSASPSSQPSTGQGLPGIEAKDEKHSSLMASGAVPHVLSPKDASIARSVQPPVKVTPDSQADDKILSGLPQGQEKSALASPAVPPAAIARRIAKMKASSPHRASAEAIMKLEKRRRKSTKEDTRKGVDAAWVASMSSHLKEGSQPESISRVYGDVYVDAVPAPEPGLPPNYGAPPELPSPKGDIGIPSAVQPSLSRIHSIQSPSVTQGQDARSGDTAATSIQPQPLEQAGDRVQETTVNIPPGDVSAVVTEAQQYTTPQPEVQISVVREDEAGSPEHSRDGTSNLRTSRGSHEMQLVRVTQSDVTLEQGSLVKEKSGITGMITTEEGKGSPVQTGLGKEPDQPHETFEPIVERSCLDMGQSGQEYRSERHELSQTPELVAVVPMDEEGTPDLPLRVPEDQERLAEKTSREATVNASAQNLPAAGAPIDTGRSMGAPYIPLATMHGAPYLTGPPLTGYDKPIVQASVVHQNGKVQQTRRAPQQRIMFALPDSAGKSPEPQREQECCELESSVTYYPESAVVFALGCICLIWIIFMICSSNPAIREAMAYREKSATSRPSTLNASHDPSSLIAKRAAQVTTLSPSQARLSLSVCDTEYCQKEAAHIMSLLSGNPCDNFYDFVCKALSTRWTPKPGSSISTDTILVDAIEETARDYILNPRNEDMTVARFVLEGCIKENGEVDLRRHEMNEMFMEYFNTMWPATKDTRSVLSPRTAWISAGYLVRDLKLHALASVSRRPSADGQPNISIIIGEPTLLYRDGDQSDKSFIELIGGAVEQSLIFMRGNENIKEYAATIKQTINVLGKFAARPTERYIGRKNYRTTRLSELPRDITPFLRAIFADDTSIGDSTTILLKSPTFFENLRRANDTGFDAQSIVNYLGFRLVTHFSAFLPLRILRELRAAELGISVKAQSELEVLCSRELERVFPAHYLRAYGLHANNFHVMAKAVASQLEAKFVETMTHIPWIQGSRTKERHVKNRFDQVRRKVLDSRRMHFFPSWVFHNATFSNYNAKVMQHLQSLHGVEPSDLISQFKTFTALQNKDLLEQGTAVNGVQEMESVFSTRVHYDVDQKVLSIPIAVINVSIPTNNMMFVNHIARYGVRIFKGMMAMLHEDDKKDSAYRTHSTDNDGRFRYALQCLVNGYNDLAKNLKSTFFGSSHDVSAAGLSMLEHTIPVMQAYKAFQEFVKIRQIWHSSVALPTMPQMSPEQVFFVLYALDNCESSGDVYRRHRFETAFTLPPEDRVNFPLSQFPEFARAFGCNHTSAMTSNHRCNIFL